MTERPPLTAIESVAQYHEYLDEIAQLATIDPPSDTPEGQRLLELADLVELYEKASFPPEV